MNGLFGPLYPHQNQCSTCLTKRAEVKPGLIYPALESPLYHSCLIHLLPLSRDTHTDMELPYTVCTVTYREGSHSWMKWTCWSSEWAAVSFPLVRTTWLTKVTQISSHAVLIAFLQRLNTTLASAVTRNRKTHSQFVNECHLPMQFSIEHERPGVWNVLLMRVAFRTKCQETSTCDLRLEE